MADFYKDSTKAMQTPFRRTRLILDTPDTVLLAPAFRWHREGKDIHNTVPAVYLHRLASGGMCLSSIYQRVHTITERLDTPMGLIALSEQSTDLHREAQTFSANATLTGALTGADTNVAGVPGASAVSSNTFHTKSIAAGESAISTINASDVTNFAMPTEPTENIKMDRPVVSNDTFSDDQWWLFRFVGPEGILNAPDTLARFYFGGATIGTAGGEFCLVLGGDGIARLKIRLPDVNGGLTWYNCDVFKYCEPSNVCANLHNIQIRPHCHPCGDKYIEFECGITSQSDVMSAGFANSFFHGTQAGHAVHLFSLSQFWGTILPTVAGADISSGTGLTDSMGVPPLTPTGSTGIDPPPMPVNTATAALKAYRGADGNFACAGAGKFRIDMRRDTDLPHQVAKMLSYPKGNLVMAPFFVSAPMLDVTIPLKVDITATYPTGTAIVIGVTNNQNNQNLLSVTPVGMPVSHQEYQPVQNAQHYNAWVQFQSSTDQTKTPILWGVEVTQDAVIAQNALTPTELPPMSLRSVNLSGPEHDPTMETGIVVVNDKFDDAPQMRRRGEIPFRLVSEYQQNSTATTTLMEGYMLYADCEPRAAGRWPKQHVCTGTLVGKWQRIHEVYFDEPYPLFDINGKGKLVSNTLRNVLNQICGFLSDQIDIPNSTLTFVPPPSGDKSGMMISVMQPIGDWIIETLQQYFGWWFVWEANCFGGMWRAKLPPQSPYQNLVHFVTSGPEAGKSQHTPDSYGFAADGAPIVPIMKFPRPHYRTMAPEINYCRMVAAGDYSPQSGRRDLLQNVLFNPASYNFDRAHPLVTPGTDPKTLGPDWVGRVKPFQYNAPGVTTQAVADLFMRRIMDVAGHGRPYFFFEAPLPFVTPQGDTVQDTNNSFHGQAVVTPRKPQFYDPCTVSTSIAQARALGGTQYLIASCGTRYNKDHRQMGVFELIQPPELLANKPIKTAR